jgi:hypothetical protein
MIAQRDNLLWYKINGLLRWAVVHGVTKPFYPLYLVNEYPKSGGSWLGQMLAEALAVPFPRNRLPMLCSCIMHGHYLNPWGLHNVVVLWRDGRDVLISQYYHSLFENEKGNSRLVRMTRENLRFADYEDIRANLPRFMEYIYKDRVSPRFNWSQFVRTWHGQDVVQVRYEDLRNRTVEELDRVLLALANLHLARPQLEAIVGRCSFEKLTGRKVGHENVRSFLRKGVVGDWRNHFTRETRQRFAEYAGNELITLGYEKDHAWAEEGIISD